jgi:glycosyltransferase involved in cell wall biosynthesis
MRVLFCTPAASAGGGVEAWLEMLTPALQRRGIEVFTALASGRFHDPARYMARHTVANPIEIDGSSGVREGRIVELLRIFRRVQPDVIVPLNLADALLAAAYAKTRGGHARLVTVLHGQSERAIGQVRSAAPFIDLAVSVSRRGEAQLARVFDRVRHIPTGVPPPLQPPTVRRALKELAYIGRLEQQEKRVLDAVPLVRALAQHGMTFHFAGSGPEEAALRDALTDARVVFHGDVPRAELYERIYPAIDAIVIFSPAEAGPIVAWEAMAHGVVPVTSDYIGRAEEGVIRDGETGTVFPVGDVPAAVQAVLRAAANVETLSRRAREELPRAYMLPAFEESWAGALQSVADRPLHRGLRRELPPLVSPGLLARLGLGVETTAHMRRLLGRRFAHNDPGSEWPN